MKLIIASALAALASAKMNDMLPFLMMDSFGNTYYTTGNSFASNPLAMMALTGNKGISKNMAPLLLSGNSGFASNPLAMMALTDNKAFKGSNSMLPFLMMDSFGNTYTTGPSVLSNPVVTASVIGQDFKAGKALTDDQLLLMSGGLQGGLSNPWALSTLTGDKRYNVADAYAMGGNIPLMAAKGNLKNFDVKPADMTLPMLVNSLAGGARPSLRQHVLPAMALAGEDIEMETILPWMLTAGQHYLGGQLGNVLPFMGNSFKKAFDSEKLMPWLVSGLNTAPVARAPISYPAPISYGGFAPLGRRIPYGIPYGGIRRAPFVGGPIVGAPLLNAAAPVVGEVAVEEP